jgi:hypothetical protein
VLHDPPAVAGSSGRDTVPPVVQVPTPAAPAAAPAPGFVRAAAAATPGQNVGEAGASPPAAPSAFVLSGQPSATAGPPVERRESPPRAGPRITPRVGPAADRVDDRATDPAAHGAASPGAAAPAARRFNPYLSNDPSQRARRLARALVSDLVAYHPQKREEGLRAGTLKGLFRDEIRKSWEEYVAQVGAPTAESTTHFQDALNDILAGGRKVF